MQPKFFVRNVRSENFKTLGAVMEKLDSNFVMSDFLGNIKDLVERNENIWRKICLKNMYVVANYDLKIDGAEPEIISECNRCKNYLVFYFKVLHEYNLYSEA